MVKKRIVMGVGVAVLASCLGAGFCLLSTTATASAEAETNIFELIEGASVRLAQPNGLRFKLKLSEDVKEGADEIGMYIFPAEYLRDVQSGDYAAELPDKLEYDLTEKLYPEDDGYWYGNAVIANIQEAHYDLEYAAVAYRKTGDETVYSDVDEGKNVRSISGVSEAAYADYSDDLTVKNLLKTFLSTKYPNLDTYYAGLGSEASPYLIRSDADFEHLADAVTAGNTYEGQYFRLETDISTSKSVGVAKHTGEDNLPYVANESKVFAGIFDGNEKKITATLTGENGYALGLFPINSGTIKNFTLEGTVTVAGPASAVVCGYNTAGATIDGVTNKIAVDASSTYRVGGICYENAGTISGCVNEAEIKALYGIGGIAMRTVGGDGNAKILTCTNKGEIICTGIDRNLRGANDGGWIGGIIGMLGSADLLDGCRNEGNITANGGEMSTSGYAGVGGIAGCSWNSNSQTKNCTNTGTVTGNFHVGGIVGWGKGIIDTCTNDGEVKLLGEAATSGGTAYYMGGIIGCSTSTTGTQYISIDIEHCENRGKVTGDSSVGGIAGYANSRNAKILDNKNSGEITGTDMVGGIVGRHPDGAGAVKEFTGNKNLAAGTVTATSNAAGIIGYFQGGGEITECDNEAAIHATGDTVGGIVGMLVSNAKITNCDNSGEVNGRGASGSNNSFLGVGGIVGTIYSSNTISGCNNTGAVNGDRFVGGIVGSQTGDRKGAKIDGCTNDGTITAKSTNTSGAYCGGIAGYIASGNISNCHSNVAIVINPAAAANTGALCGKIKTTEGENSGNTTYEDN